MPCCRLTENSQRNTRARGQQGQGTAGPGEHVPGSWWPAHTFPSRLDGDFLTDVAAAGGGDGSHPEHVLLPAVQVGNAVEELVRAGLVLTGSLWRSRWQKVQPVRDPHPHHPCVGCPKHPSSSKAEVGTAPELSARKSYLWSLCLALGIPNSGHPDHPIALASWQRGSTGSHHPGGIPGELPSFSQPPWQSPPQQCSGPTASPSAAGCQLVS